MEGIRAALCTDCFCAEATRLHNDANVLAMGGRVVGPGLAIKIVETFLNTPFSGEERHERRIHLIEHEGETGSKDFRTLVSEIAMLMCYEATRELPLTDVEIETPICKTTVKELEGKKMAVVPILRAGLGMVEGMLAMIPAAKIGHIGLYRDPETLAPVDCAEREVFVVDPMLATGGSATAAITMLKEKGAKKIHFMCIIASPEGIEKMHEVHPDVDVFVGALDDHLNEHGYIVPGLGDAGDRIFGTM